MKRRFALKPPAKRFDIGAVIAHHDAAQAEPHPMQAERSNTIRSKRVGRLVARFFLPLDECKPANRSRGAGGAMVRAAARNKLLKRMGEQFALCQQSHLTGTPLKLPLPGRPIVHCIRYGSVEPDATAVWAKTPVDILQPPGVRTTTRTVKTLIGDRTVTSKRPYGGLDIIASDRPARCHVVEWWEPAKRGNGFCVIEIYTGVEQ